MPVGTRHGSSLLQVLTCGFLKKQKNKFSIPPPQIVSSDFQDFFIWSWNKGAIFVLYWKFVPV